ncbi:dihydroxyacetone kinase phosphoryl donor subunit DhaM [Candidatus Oscillochloris fontis]|uniref:dihydroxyacetone kinase phosphoryl donor subunit DhaM n=1 Tax=Candidatus Oscillochloris fontis TaxID=2496868 RepID=UPI00101B768E|nr:dihydroxyacetone kinase phosphoryl donor subunit DhaM [Candidatus Oscillochloris fontis]
MIGLLIISHSTEIASGVKALVEQMAQGRLPIIAAGGTLEGDLGTSTDVIMAAIEQLGSVEAVLALVDMGSAIMSAEIALEMSGLPFRISPAPLVEGALVAAVEATRPGVSLAEVSLAAERALEAKHEALGSGALLVPITLPSQVSRSHSEIVLTVTNKVGLHMRPAKDFVQLASRFKAQIRARNLDRPDRSDGNAKSIIDVMKLGVTCGHQIAISAEGDDAQVALKALAELIRNNFGEAPSFSG